MIRFYSPDILTTRALSEEESAHAVRVLRHHAGDELEIVDGKGHLYRGILITEHSKRAMVEIVEETYLPKIWTPEITLAVAPTKNMDRMEWLVEKAVEIGVDRIVPLLCDRSERKVIKRERLQKIAVSAMKQSLKALLPQIEEIQPLKEYIYSAKAPIRTFGYCDANTGKTPFVEEYKAGTDVVIMIGPEGDFSPSEVECLIKEGWQPVTFGDNRLRTETAALYGLQAVHIINQYNSLHHE